MSNELVLVGNPARRRKSRKTRRSASPAQRRARALFAKRYGGKKTAKRRSTRRSAPTVIVANPARRRRSTHRHVAVSHRRRRARRNPIGGGSMLRGIVGQLKSAAFGAGGAVAVDVAYGYALGYLPDAFKTPVAADGSMNYGYYAGKAATAFGVGMLARHLIGSARAARIVEGSLTVTLHDVAKHLATKMLPSVHMGYLSPGRMTGAMAASERLPSMSAMGEYLSGGMGEYLSAGERESIYQNVR